MGPSGAGKSTLLDILAFRKTTGKWTTDIRLNGALLNKQTFVKESGYVTSDDLLTPEYTVTEMLKFGAALRLPSDWSQPARDARVSIRAFDNAVFLVHFLHADQLLSSLHANPHFSSCLRLMTSWR
jgi:ABC-type multidrug transport system ATPase subunit